MTWPLCKKCAKTVGPDLHSLSPSCERINMKLICCGVVLAEGLGKYGCPNCNGDKVARPVIDRQCDFVRVRRIRGKRYVLSRDRCRRRIQPGDGRCWQHKATS